MKESSFSNQAKLLKKTLKLMKNIIKNQEKNNSLEDKFKNKTKFLSYIEEKFKKFNIQENEKKIILDSVEKIFNFKDTTPIDITDKKYKKVIKEIDFFLEMNKGKNAKKESEFFISELLKVINKYKFNNFVSGQLLEYAFEKKNIDKKVSKILMKKYTLKIMEKTITLFEKMEKYVFSFVNYGK
jgi:hypothetical protein